MYEKKVEWVVLTLVYKTLHAISKNLLSKGSFALKIYRRMV